MKFTKNADACGTCLKGEITTIYSALVEVFGEPDFGPNGDSGDGKVTCEWSLRFEDGTVATIYDYKTGRTPFTEYSWHIGGNNSNAVSRVWGVIKAQQKVLTSDPIDV